MLPFAAGHLARMRFNAHVSGHPRIRGERKRDPVGRVRNLVAGQHAAVAIDGVHAKRSTFDHRTRQFDRPLDGVAGFAPLALKFDIRDALRRGDGELLDRPTGDAVVVFGDRVDPIRTGREHRQVEFPAPLGGSKVVDGARFL